MKDFKSHRLRKLCSAPSGDSLKEMREKDSKDERGTREVLEIFRSASPLVTFLRPSFIPFYRIIRSTELFGEF